MEAFLEEDNNKEIRLNVPLSVTNELYDVVNEAKEQLWNPTKRVTKQQVKRSLLEHILRALNCTAEKKKKLSKSSYCFCDQTDKLCALNSVPICDAKNQKHNSFIWLDVDVFQYK